MLVLLTTDTTGCNYVAADSEKREKINIEGRI